MLTDQEIRVKALEFVPAKEAVTANSLVEKAEVIYLFISALPGMTQQKDILGKA
jgi:hypothetical protein